MDTNKTGRLIAEKRKELNLNQAQLAEILHVSDKAISRWETGRGFPDISILEDLSAALNITVYELLKGERQVDQKTLKENETFTKESLSVFKEVLNRKKAASFLTGFILSLITLIIVLVHLNAPIYMEAQKDLLRIEKLGDRLVAITSEKIDGYALQEVDLEGSNEVFISIYKTALGKLRNTGKQEIILLGDTDQIDAVYLYPGEEEDVLVYGNSKSAGVVSLPRLIYNSWLLLSILGTFISAILYVVFRKRYFGRHIFNYLLIPFASLSVSMILVLWDRFNKVYNASYYFSGIVLLTICFILLVRLVSILLKRK